MIFDLVFKNFWLVCMAIMTMNAGVWHWRSRRHIARDPDLADGYRKLIKGLILFGNIPFVVLGVGVVFGGVPSVFHYFRPQDMNPYILAFHGSVGLLWILGSWWLFAWGGAEMLTRHPGLFRPHISSPLLIKLLWLLFLAAGVTAVVVMSYARIPVGPAR